MHFSKAPITEAVIDFKVIFADTVAPESWEQLEDVLPKSFTKRKIFTRSAIVHFEGDEIPEAQLSSVFVGYSFANERFVIQAKLEGFTLSILPPYDNWNEFRGKAEEYWKLYCTVQKPTYISRIATRYINKLDIPIGQNSVIKLEDYLCIYPEVPGSTTDFAMDNFFMQVRLPQMDIDAILLVNQASTAASHPGVTSIVLDFDIFCERAENPWLIDESDYWGILEKLRLRKNQIFEVSITDAMKALIQ